MICLIDDPEYPSLNPHYREYISDKNLFKNVLPLQDDILDSIHQIFRAQYLKDVVLARILEDDCYTLLMMFIRSKQDEVLRYLLSEEQSKQITESLYSLLTLETCNVNEKLNILGFIRELGAAVKVSELAPVFFRQE